MHPGHLTDEELSALIDGELAESERGGIEGHLVDCRACAERLEQLRHTVVLVQHMPAVVPPRSFVLTNANAAPALRPLPMPPPPAPPASTFLRPTWLRVLSGVAAAVMVILLFADAIRPAPPPAVPAVVRSVAVSGDQAPDGTAARLNDAGREAQTFRFAGPTVTPMAPNAQIAPAEAPAAAQESRRDETSAAERPAAPPAAGAPGAASGQASGAPPLASGPAPGAPPAPASQPPTPASPAPSAAQLVAVLFGVTAFVFALASFLVARRR